MHHSWNAAHNIQPSCRQLHCIRIQKWMTSTWCTISEQFCYNYPLFQGRCPQRHLWFRLSCLFSAYSYGGLYARVLSVLPQLSCLFCSLQTSGLRLWHCLYACWEPTSYILRTNLSISLGSKSLSRYMPYQLLLRLPILLDLPPGAV